MSYCQDCADLHAKLQAAEAAGREIMRDMLQEQRYGKRLRSRIAELEAENALLKDPIDWTPGDVEFQESDGTTRILKWESGDESVGLTAGFLVDDNAWEDHARTATEDALRYAYQHVYDSATNDSDTFVRMGVAALLGEDA